MQLTLAMGLKYEPGSGYSLLSDDKSRQESDSVRPKISEPVIDVEAVEVRSGTIVAPPNSLRRFEYLFYDLHAGLVMLPEIGSQLDTTI